MTHYKDAYVNISEGQMQKLQHSINVRVVHQQV